MFCVINIYRLFLKVLQAVVINKKSVCLCSTWGRVSFITGARSHILVWRYRHWSKKVLGRRQKSKILVIWTKRSTFCIVYYCSVINTRPGTISLSNFHIWSSLRHLTEDSTSTAFWKCLVLFCAPGVCEYWSPHLSFITTLQHFRLNIFVLPFYQTRWTSCLLICDSPVQFSGYFLFVLKCFGLLDMVLFLWFEDNTDTVVIWSHKLSIQVLLKWFLKRAAFQFLELLQVAFLELLQDITKVYSIAWEEETDQTWVLFLWEKSSIWRCWNAGWQ